MKGGPLPGGFSRPLETAFHVSACIKRLLRTTRNQTRARSRPTDRLTRLRYTAVCHGSGPSGCDDDAFHCLVRSQIFRRVLVCYRSLVSSTHRPGQESSLSRLTHYLQEEKKMLTKRARAGDLLCGTSNHELVLSNFFRSFSSLQIFSFLLLSPPFWVHERRQPARQTLHSSVGDFSSRFSATERARARMRDFPLNFRRA